MPLGDCAPAPLQEEQALRSRSDDNTEDSLVQPNEMLDDIRPKSDPSCFAPQTTKYSRQEIPELVSLPKLRSLDIAVKDVVDM